MTNDLAKNRYAGLQGYTEYRNLCFDDDITSFDDLEDIMSPEVSVYITFFIDTP